ncbi:MAG TPA: DUF4382 domain-containing protein [Blastocatellia bacterium]|nr:DUF4382 domain-containing protein [Blastocatellia bacterium]
MKHPRWFPALILLWLCSLTLAAQAQQVSVSAADYSPGLAPGAITAAFGVEMAGATEAATSLPLPTRLAGTRVLVNGEAAPLFFVSANQINYLIPEDTAAGDAEVVIERDGVAKSREMIRVRSAAFSIFTQDQSGSGAGAIIDGRTYRGGPFSVHTDQGEQTILALYGTGLGEAGSSSFVSSRVHVYVGGIEAKVHYAGPQRGLAGLDQLNFELPDAVADHGTLPVTVKVDDQPSNSVTLDVVSAEMASVSVALTTSTVSVNGATSVNFSPFPDIDSLKVTLKSFNLVTDKGVEVSVISTPQTIDLLSPESAAKLLRVLQLRAGVYVAETAEISEVVASFKGQPVKIALAKKTVQQKLPEPFKLEKDSTVGVSLGFDLRASVRKQPDGSYLFDPVLLLGRIVPSIMPPLQTISGKVAGIDKATKQFKLLRSEGSNTSTILIDASKAAIISEQGKPTDFSALATDQKVDVVGKLDDKGVVQAVTVYIGGIRPPARPAFVIGAVSSIDRTARTFEVKVESFSGPIQTFVKPDKLTIRWDDKTRFVDDIRGPIKSDDLAVGNRVSVQIPDFRDLVTPSLASDVVISHPHVAGTIADVAGLPASFVVSLFTDPRILGPANTPGAPTRLVTINLKATTQIRNILNEMLTPRSLIVGSQVDVLVDSLAGNTATAELVIVIGVQLKGSVAPADVKAADSSFVLTQANGTRVAVKVDAKTVLIASEGSRVQQLKPDEFFKLLLNKPYTLEVFGLVDAPNAVRALTIRLAETK